MRAAVAALLGSCRGWLSPPLRKHPSLQLRAIQGLRAVAGDAASSPSYGYPLRPCEITDLDHGELLDRRFLGSAFSEWLRQTDPSYPFFEDCATKTSVALTMSNPWVTNQDRSIVVDPYCVNDEPCGVLLGVFDGHGSHRVSELIRSELPGVLGNKLQQQAMAEGEDGWNESAATKQALIDSFVELDGRASEKEFWDGGSCASVVFVRNDKIYIANAGDSTSFIVTCRSSSAATRIEYISQSDTPAVPAELARIKAAGGSVEEGCYHRWKPEKYSDDVKFRDPLTGRDLLLAVSRAIGDWPSTEVGVIPDPIVDVLDLQTIVKQELAQTRADDGSQSQSANGGQQDLHDDVYIFAVCASDGFLDYLDPADVAEQLSGYATGDVKHPFVNMQLLLHCAEMEWRKATDGRYRDDMSVAVSTLRVPPSAFNRPSWQSH